MNTDKKEKPASAQIDDIIQKTTDWRGDMLATLRAVIMKASPDIVEEVKWKKPSKPEGVAAWTANGNVCLADILKNAVRLTFPKGASLDDPERIFNTRLDSKTVRAIDFYEEASVNEAALRGLILQAIAQNKK